MNGLDNAPHRFWQQVIIPLTPAPWPGHCWEWTGCTVKGYGQFNLRWWKTAKGWRSQTVRAHRFAYEHVIGPIPKGLTIEHECRNKACVRPGPGHCIPLERGENARRGNTLKICKAGLHEMIGKNVIRRPSRPSTSGECRACANSRKRKSK